MTTHAARNLHRQPVPDARRAVAHIPVAHVEGPPQLQPLGAADSATVHELLVSTQQQTATLRQSLAELVELVQAGRAGAVPVVIELTQARPAGSSDHGAFASLGVYNPNAHAVFIGRGGEPARPGVGALVVPANGAVVLPLAGSLVDVGADPTALPVAPASSLVWLFRYATVQPLHVGRLA